MSNQCIPLQELESLLTPEPGDPRLVHLETCPRCRAELAMLRSFLEGDPDQADDLRQELLGQRMQKIILGKAAENKDQLLGGRPLKRSLLAMAAVLLVFLAINRFQGPGGAPDIHLRGGSAGLENALTIDAKRVGDSRLLSWSAVPGADSYQVEILASDLQLLDRIPVSGNPALEVSPQQLRPWQERSVMLLWRVSAFAGDRLLAQSSPRAMVAPDRP